MSLYGTMLDCVATVRRPTIGRDRSQGVTQDPFVIVTSNIPCACHQSSPSVNALYSQRNAVVSTSIYFGSDPGIEVNDLIIVTDRLNNVRTYVSLGECQPIGRGVIWQVHATYTKPPTN